MREGFPRMGEEHECERHEPVITWGELPLNGGVENPSVWRGAISAKLSTLKERFGFSDEAGVKDLMSELKAKVKHFYIEAIENAVVRCIDGRSESEEIDVEPTLGPQVPGGAPVMCLSWRIATGLEGATDINTDLRSFKELIKKLPYIPGAHEDELNADDPENTGCGAIDKMLDILKIMGEFDEDDSGKSFRVYDYTKAIALDYCGDEATFDSVFEDVQINLQSINGRHYNDRYFKKDEKTGRHRFRKGLVNGIKDLEDEVNRKTVERLRGAHNEVFLLINKVPGETFDRDGFAALTGGKAQAFGYDVWHAAGRAEALFPDDPVRQKTMIMTNVMYAVATAMALTDGSLEYGIRE